MREKLRDRVFTVSVPQLTLHIPKESLPQRLGGTLEIQHEAWLLHCLKSMTNRTNGGEIAEVAPSSNSNQASPNGSCVSTPTSPIEQAKLKNGIGNNIGEIEITNGDTDEASSPVQPPSSASSGFSDDDSLHGDVGLQTVTIDQFIENVHSRGRAGLIAEYAEIKQRPPDGSFNNAKLVSKNKVFILFANITFIT